MNQGRRKEDSNLVAYGYRLLRGECITPLLRSLAFVYAAALSVWGIGLIFHNGRSIYDDPALDGVFTVAHPVAWGVCFWLAGCLMLATAISGRALIFLVAMIVTVAVMLGWTGGVVSQVLLSDVAELTTGTAALYMMGFTGIASMALAPKPLEHEVEILERTTDGVLVPLKPSDRRAG